MSKQSGVVVFTATPEMAKQMPKVFKTGATYVAQRATAVALGPTPRKKRATTKKATKKTGQKVTKKRLTRKKQQAAKPVAKPVAKSTKRKPIRPDLIIGFVKKNEGCNMTDIEGHTNLPQTTIRRVLNTARESGKIRTEGQRRGLRYFVGGGAPIAAAALVTSP